MNFLAPLFLLGLGAIAVPVVIHLIGRRKAERRPFAAFDFLLGVKKEVARKAKLRQWLLLLARALAVAAVALTLARPFRRVSADGVSVEAGPQAAVIVLDNGFSMGYRRGGETLLTKARRRARELVQQLGHEAEVALVLGAEAVPGEPAAPIDQLTRDQLRVTDAIDAAALTTRRGDLTSALRRAAAILDRAPNEARRVYLLSDGTAASLRVGERPWPDGPSAPELHVIDVSGGAQLPNVALVGARVRPEPRLGARGVEITADIANFGDARVASLPVTLWVEGNAVARGLAEVDAHGRGVKKFAYTFPSGGVFDAMLEIGPDALAIDNKRYLRVEVRKDLKVLLVDGDPRPAQHEDELFYLETALRPGDRADSALAVATTAAPDLGRRRLADHDVVFLANVPALPATQAAELGAFVQRGGGLFIAMGDKVDEAAYAATMAGLLPQELRSARSTGPVGGSGSGSGSGGGASPDDDSRAERILHFDARHPVFSVFPPRAPELRAARFHRFFLLAPQPDDDERRVLAQLTSGAPLLVEGKLGAGRILLYTSTLDRDWNDLPIHPGFLPLVQQSARYLARAPLREPEPPGVVGRVRELELVEGDQRLEIARPSGKKIAVDASRLTGRRYAFAGAVEPGIYRVAVAGQSGALRARPTLSFAVNVDPAESDLAKLAAGDAALPRVAGVGAAAGEVPKRRQPWWHWMAAGLLGLLCLEAFLSRRG